MDDNPIASIIQLLVAKVPYQKYNGNPPDCSTAWRFWYGTSATNIWIMSSRHLVYVTGVMKIKTFIFYPEIEALW